MPKGLPAVVMQTPVPLMEVDDSSVEEDIDLESSGAAEPSGFLKAGEA